MKFKIFAFLLMFVALTSKAQDPHFSQIQYNPLYLNPAFTGFANNKDNRLVALYRDQWRNVPVKYSTTFASYDRKLLHTNSGHRIGLGVSILYDKAGDGALTTTNPNLSLAYGKYFNNDKQLLSIGGTVGITMKSLNYSKLTFDNQFDGINFDPSILPDETFSNNNVSFANFTIGLNFRTKIGSKSNMDIGGSASNLHQPDQDFLYVTSDKLPARYTAYAKGQIGLNNKWNLQPGVYYQRQNKYNETLINAIAEYKFKEQKSTALCFGAGYRVKDAVIAYVSVLYNNLRIGASYDITHSDFKKANRSNGAFELALNYEFGESENKKKKQKCDTIKIPTYIYQTDTVYIDKIDTLIIDKNINNSKDCDVIKDEIQKLLPLKLYFNNDEPNPRTTAKTTTANYKDLMSSYIAQKNVFEKNIDNNEVADLFTLVNSEFDKVKTVHNKINELLEKGKKITLEFKGFASPLAKSDYNYNLSLRRIESVKIFLEEYNNGILKKYVTNGQLKFSVLPYGEMSTENNISDDVKNTKKSVYSLDASKERRVEIKYVTIE